MKRLKHISLNPKKLGPWLSKEVHIAPLAMFRVLFGGVMLASILRFIAKGWVYELYIAPEFHFSYYGFAWVKPLGEIGMYLLFGLMALAAFLIMLGLFYKLSASLFFLCFTYGELIDKSNYLNHYYFISIVAFLMILVPAHRYFSLDVIRQPKLKVESVPRWTIGIFKLQLGLVYIFAGIAKLNPDWLFQAAPLKYWLPAKSHLPIVGGLMKLKATAFFMSWFGAIYDLFIVFFLLIPRTRLLAYGAVIGFHLMTWWLFQIGMFPFIMILSTLIFFSEDFHKSLIKKLGGLLAKVFGNWQSGSEQAISQDGEVQFEARKWNFGGLKQKVVFGFLGLHFLIQVALPFRYTLYPDKLFWTEEGYRFSWRVMLMEKAGYAIFSVTDPETGRTGEVFNSDYLSPNQEKMMATQPDMILQFAHFIEKEYQKQGIENPEVKANVYVTLNGSGSRPYINPEVNLAEIEDSWRHKDWILPFYQNN